MNIGDVNKFVSAASKLPGRATNAPAGMGGAAPFKPQAKTLPAAFQGATSGAGGGGGAVQSDQQQSMAMPGTDPQVAALQARVAALESQLATLLNAVSVGPGGNLTISSSARVEIQASVITLSAGMINAETGMLNADGIVKCSTMMADSVVASSYTPGAGNIW